MHIRRLASGSLLSDSSRTPHRFRPLPRLSGRGPTVLHWSHDPSPGSLRSPPSPQGPQGRGKKSANFSPLPRGEGGRCRRPGEGLLLAKLPKNLTQEVKFQTSKALYPMPPFSSAARTLPGVSGRVGTRTPMALATALEIAAPGEITGGSPRPTTPRSS